MPNYPYYNAYNAYPMQMNVGATQPTQNGIIWVSGEAGAKGYMVGAGQSVLLMDAEGSSFYIKSSDASGMPLPLRIFDYTERTSAPQNIPAAADMEKYVTREEFAKWAKKLKESLITKEKPNE